MRKTSPILWGVFLIMVGTLLLLERFGKLHLPEGLLWPLIVFFVGVGELVRLRYAAAALYMCLALVFLGCTLHLYGMSYGKSWPLLLVFVGVSMVMRAWSGGGSRWRREEEEHHE